MEKLRVHQNRGIPRRLQRNSNETFAVLGKIRQTIRFSFQRLLKLLNALETIQHIKFFTNTTTDMCNRQNQSGQNQSRDKRTLKRNSVHPPRLLLKANHIKPQPVANANTEIAPCTAICDHFGSIIIRLPPTHNHIAVGPRSPPKTGVPSSEYTTVRTPASARARAIRHPFNS